MYILGASHSHRLTDHLINPRLEEFKKDLQGGIDKGVSESAPSLPSMEIQREFLRLDGNEDAGISIRKTELTENAVLVSASLEDHGFTLPSQLAPLGQINAPRENITDPRIMLNTNIPFSVFVCGVQGSGKSHTTACMIENCSVAHPALGNLQQSILTLVLPFDEYTSPVSSKPSEAAFLARILPQYAYGNSVPLRVLVSPTNLHNLKRLYEQIPNVEVRPFKIQTQHLNISMMLSLMSVSSGAGIQDGKGCENDVSVLGYSQARVEIRLCRGNISEKSSKNLVKLLLCNQCRHQVNRVRQWLQGQPFLPCHGQLDGQKRNQPNHGESGWVTSRFHEVVQG